MIDDITKLPEPTETAKRLRPAKGFRDVTAQEVAAGIIHSLIGAEAFRRNIGKPEKK